MRWPQIRQLRIFPREEKFFELFEASAANIVTGADMLRDLFHTFTDIPTRAEQIKKVEHAGDLIIHEVMRRLNRSFVTPLDREDIHDLASRLDDVIDTIEAVAARVHLYQIEKATEEAVALSDIIYVSAQEVAAGVGRLRTLRDIERHCVEINRLENEGDQLLRAAYATLFAGQYPAEHIIKWKDIYEYLEETTDRCEDVANILEAIVVKNA